MGATGRAAHYTDSATLSKLSSKRPTGPQTSLLNSPSKKPISVPNHSVSRLSSLLFNAGVVSRSSTLMEPSGMVSLTGASIFCAGMATFADCNIRARLSLTAPRVRSNRAGPGQVLVNIVQLKCRLHDSSPQRIPPASTPPWWPARCRQALQPRGVDYHGQRVSGACKAGPSGLRGVCRRWYRSAWTAWQQTSSQNGRGAEVPQ